MPDGLTLLNDLELVDLYIDKCQQFVNPKLLRAVSGRGLYNVINFLPSDINEAKAVARARMGKMGKCFGAAEIDSIANDIQRLEALREKFLKMEITDSHNIREILNQMEDFNNKVLNYFKK